MKYMGFTNTKTMSAVLGAAGVTVFVLGVTLIPRNANGEFDFNGLSQQVQNHEARITNNEKDIAKLQANTNTAPAGDKVDVPASSTSTTTVASSNNVSAVQPIQSPTPTATPAQAEAAPKTVQRVEHINCSYNNGSGNTNPEEWRAIETFYSDGSVTMTKDDGSVSAHACGQMPGTW